LRLVAAVQAKAGDFAGALETAATIEDAESKAFALREIAALQMAAGRQWLRSAP